MYITASPSSHSVVIEGPSEKINAMKRKLRTLLMSNKDVGDDIFIELQSVFKTSKITQPIKSIDLEKGLTQPKQEISEKGKKFFEAFSKLSSTPEVEGPNPEVLTLPPIPAGELSLEELKAKFGFEVKGRYCFINVPEELRETLRILKLINNPDPEETRFSLRFDEEDSKLPPYNFEIDNKAAPFSLLSVRRPPNEDNDFVFYIRVLKLLNFYEPIGSGPILNKFLKRAVNYLKYATSKYSADVDFDPLKVPEFHCELLGRPSYDLPPVENFTQLQVQIPIFNAIFLIEMLCPHQQQENKCNFSKPFLDRKTIYLLSILAPLPVAFQLGPNSSVILSFADSDIGSAEFVFNQVKFAMEIFNNLPRIEVCFQNVDSNYFSSGKLITISQNLNLALIRGLDTNLNGILGTFQIWGVPSQKGDDQVKALQKECEDIYNEIQLFSCDQCRRMFSNGYGGECTLSEHTGEMIKFGDGLMEHISITEEMDEVVTVNYSCCGEVLKFSAGCQEMVFPHGHLKAVDENGKEISYSNFSFLVI